ncbi:MAG: hypothetical protein WBD36_05045, partial [Bacteroidota bacterium]
MPQPIIRTLPTLLRWQVISLLAGLGSQVILSRYLGPHGKGIVDLFLLVPATMISIMEAGLLSANTYFAGKKITSIQILHTNSLVWCGAWGV